MEYTEDGASESELLDPVEESQETLNSTIESDEPPVLVLLSSHNTGPGALCGVHKICIHIPCDTRFLGNKTTRLMSLLQYQTLFLLVKRRQCKCKCMYYYNNVYMHDIVYYG